jgi:hypothetical protein
MTWVIMRLYPALALLYGGGIAALARGHYSTFAALLTKVIVRSLTGERPLVLSLYPQAAVQERVAQLLPGLERHYTPMSDHLFDWLRDPLREFILADDVYEKPFDRFEYLRALVHGDILQKTGNKYGARLGSLYGNIIRGGQAYCVSWKMSSTKREETGHLLKLVCSTVQKVGSEKLNKE